MLSVDGDGGDGRHRRGAAPTPAVDVLDVGDVAALVNVCISVSSVTRQQSAEGLNEALLCSLCYFSGTFRET